MPLCFGICAISKQYLHEVLSMTVQFSPTIISQHVDTLVTAHKILDAKNLHAYWHKLMILDKYKCEAQELSGENKERCVVHELFGFGKFKIFAQGSGIYKYRIENDDFSVILGDIKQDSNRANASVRYKQSFLIAVGHTRAYNLVKVFINHLMGKTKDTLSEIHLATDLWGVRYDFSDNFRFQTKFKRSDYGKVAFASMELLNVQSVGGRMLETIAFGRNEFMFRIYDKLKELNKKPEDLAVILPRWIANGYNQDKNGAIWRHEIQLRGSHLKKHFPPDCKNQVETAFQKLDSLWAYALSKIEFVDLSDEEVMRSFKTNNTATVVKIFQRAKQDESRYSHFDVLSRWNNKIAERGSEYKAIKESKRITAEKAAKYLVSASYKANGADMSSVSDILADVPSGLKQFEGVTLHEYGALKVLDSFVKNEQMILQIGCIPQFHQDDFYKAERAYYECLGSISHKEHSVLKKFKEIMQTRQESK